MNKDIKALRQQLEQLQKSHREGSVGKKAFEAGKAQLEREILQAVLAAPEAAAAGAQAPRPSRALTAGVLSFVVVLAVAGYAWTGSPGVPSAGPPTAAAAEGGNPHASGAVDEAQFIAAVEQLAERLKGQPDDVEGWAMLARSYGMLGRLDDALPAYQKAVALNGQDARLLADYADTLALKNDRNLEGEPLALVERALKIEPTNLKALSLAGAAAFNRKDYAGAVRYWERVVQHAPAESPYLPQVQASIAEARERGGLGPASGAAAPAKPPPVAVAAAKPAAAPVATPAPDAAGGATIRGTVRLAPALAMMAAPTDAVFIFARPAEGSRMPLAIVRKQVKDLPVDFVLDDSMAMSPGAKLSLFPQVVVSARVSKSGQAVPSAGDLSGQSAPIAPTASGLLIEINEVVKN
ncbi:MAG: c-type cytochrome biogenesis protein CcmI [Betaproteobacteria bacterium]|jgi:cytochrome c-type biogenesis protein CcmH|nr:c-type cytochrome biogenesis protein CcmI [Betaproteobacteria bacterium]MBP6316809.1 c-type cytochrome biogenesis protein CcmI [Rubrivivax sp.]MBK7275241.1 c-type cytochrome biogenesis protein CcmI [Betaproteobacteria bacterium]MBK7459242.1 c-type cytochrome biogenesis protein CcmI [Betaproteobacteria bacterium]MBK7514421.1 c-type cytochrome biogenesis protein CcmI [Betaproteobacteria bacterium]